MWAGIKHALNSTLGTANFKSLDKIINESAANNDAVLAQMQSNMLESEELIKWRTHELYYDVTKMLGLGSIYHIPKGYNAINPELTFSIPESVVEVVLPTSAVTIMRGTVAAQELGAFSKLTNLAQIVLPPSIKSIESQCFENTKIEYIKLPRNITSINPTAFGGAARLWHIACEFSRERAIELGFADQNPWGAPSPYVSVSFGVK